ncbi:MAG TPA: hypothetical protein VNN17_00820 [Terriglobia bacterium]|nr:hypothetical protein [Terriglobia bacterium]
MNRRIVLLNLVLLALAGVLGWRIRERWLASERQQTAVLKKDVPPAPVLPPEPAPAIQPPTPADYIDVAQHTLFSRDRDPNVVVVVEAPPPPPPPPPRPPLPRYHGQMALADPVVILSLDGKLKRYRAGEKIGEFTVAGWDQSTLTLEWNGERIESELETLKPPPEELARAKGAPPAKPQAAAQAPAAAKAANTGEMGSKGKDEGKGKPGRQVGAFRTCEPGDNSPAGTVADGYRKVMSVGLMGAECHWEPIN